MNYANQYQISFSGVNKKELTLKKFCSKIN